MTTKQQLIDAIKRLPDDASLDDILDHIYVVLKIERGIAAGRVGDKVSLAEAREEFRNQASK